MVKSLKNKKGITLIALVITIIVLLILAGVSIATLTGENGILTKVSDSKAENKKGEERDQITLAYNAARTEKLSKGDSGKITKEELKNELKYNGITIANSKISQNEVGTITVEMPSGNKYTATQDGVIKYIGTEDPNRAITLAEEISETNYGDYINYNVDLGIDGDQDGETTDVDDWRIFYKDNSGNVFIIAADYIPASKIGGETGMMTEGSYCAYWNSPTYTEIDTSVAQLFKFGFNYSNATSKSNMGAVSSLLNKNSWGRYAIGVKGATAIGGPTLEMYIASWNEKYPNNLLYCNNSTSTGYYVGEVNNPTSYNIDMSSKTGYSDTLYYPHTSAYNDCKGYWLASPSADYNVRVDDYSYIMTVLCDGNIYGWSNRSNYHLIGVRPVVCLPSGITGKQGIDRVWNIIK